MSKSISNTLKNLDKKHEQFNATLFNALIELHVEKINNGYGLAATTKRRIIEVACSSDLGKASLVPHHSKIALEHLVSYKSNHIDNPPNRESTVNERLNTLYPKLSASLGARLEPIFTQDMLDTFPKLNEYAQRWNIWAQELNEFIVSLGTVTKHLSGTDATQIRHNLFIGKFHEMYDAIVSLLHDLMALGDLCV